MWSALLAVAMFLIAGATDFLSTRYVQAVQADALWAAIVCSVAMWLTGVIGLAVVVNLSWWYLVPEGLGLAAGTWLAMRRGRA